MSLEIESQKMATATIGMKGRAQNKMVRDEGKEACQFSGWIHILSGKKDRVFRDVGSGDGKWQ
jgi:hypothetical protein